MMVMLMVICLSEEQQRANTVTLLGSRLRGSASGVRGTSGGRQGDVTGQYLPHTCWERCTTISPSLSGNYDRPRSSEPPRSRLPPPERDMREKCIGEGVHRGCCYPKRQRVLPQRHIELLQPSGSDVSRYKHISHPQYILKCGNKIH